MKKLKLRAFQITSTNINVSNSELYKNLKEHLNNSKKEVNNRRMLLNAEDIQCEQDLLSDFEQLSDTNNPIFCTMLRVALGNQVAHVNSELFSKEKFTLAELKNTDIDSGAVYRTHYYFTISHNYLITNLGCNISITRLQTYLNWLVNDLYELTPLIDKDILPTLAEVKHIIVSDKNHSSSRELFRESNGTSYWEKARELGKDLLANLSSSTKPLSTLELEEMISAQLIIHINKPNDTNSRKMQKAYGALLKPIEDIENFEFSTRDNRKIIKGKDMCRIKEVTIETTENRFLNERQLSQEMTKFIRELEHEQQTALCQ